MKPSHITIAEAAQILGVSPQRIRVLVKKGKLPAVQSGQQWLVERAAVIARKKGAPGNVPLPPRKPSERIPSYEYLHLHYSRFHRLANGPTPVEYLG